MRVSIASISRASRALLVIEAEKMKRAVHDHVRPVGALALGLLFRLAPARRGRR